LTEKWSFAGQTPDDRYGDYHVYQDFVLNVDGLDGPHLRKLDENPCIWEAAARTLYLEHCYFNDLQECQALARGDDIASDSDD